MRKLQLFWLKPLLLCAPHHNFWAKLLLRKTMRNLKYQMRKNKKYTLPTRSFIRIAYRKKLQKKTWENDFFLKKKVCYIHSVEEICVLNVFLSHFFVGSECYEKTKTKNNHTTWSATTQNTHSIDGDFYGSLLRYGSLWTSLFIINDFHFTPLLSRIRICTVYLDIFCMYVNKCCFDAMFFLTRKFQSLRILSILAEESLPWWLLKLWWSWWWFEFLFNCWSKQLQTGPSSLVDWYK